MLTKELKKQLKKASETMGDNEARYLVEQYYSMQKQRIAARAQCRSASEDAPMEVTSTLADEYEELENNIKANLDVYTSKKPIGIWLKSICGIGPVLAAGLMAHIDIHRIQTAGQLQAFAGLDPTREWKKGEKRPYNQKLKTICWKIGESFVKVSSNAKDVYGKIYKERKVLEQERNERLEYADQAREKLEKCKIGKTTDAYKAYSVGKLPPAHIQERSKRYAVKLFLSHLFEAWYRIERHEMPPKPYAISILNHAHYIEIPNIELVEELEKQ